MIVLKICAWAQLKAVNQVYTFVHCGVDIISCFRTFQSRRFAKVLAWAIAGETKIPHAIIRFHKDLQVLIYSRRRITVTKSRVRSLNGLAIHYL